MTDKDELYKLIIDAVVAFDEEKVKELARKSLEEGCDPVETIVKGLSSGMLSVGSLFEKHEYFVPEVLMCADAMQAGLDILRPCIKEGSAEPVGQVVIGTVQGDVHDIGKNIVKLMLDVSGFTVHDLGKDVPLNRFAEEAERTGAEIVAMSALMTTTMMGMKKAVQMVRESNPHAAIMLGGAPLRPEIVRLFGGDGFADTASGVVEEALRMLALFRDRKGKRHVQTTLD
jgi:corrinoid protein of di/trimethylamine methyltransferase